MNRLFNPQGFEWFENIDNEIEQPLPPPLFAPRKRAASLQIDTKSSFCGEDKEFSPRATNSDIQRPKSLSKSSSGDRLPPLGRARSASNESLTNTLEQNFVDLVTSNLSSRMTEIVIELFARLLPPLKLRTFYFTVSLVVLSLVIFGQASNSLSMNGVPPLGWYSFFLQVMATDIGTCIIDEVLFLLIDWFWLGAEEIRLYAHCLNGPLSFILTVSIVNTGLSTKAVPQSIASWNPMMSTVITIWTLYTIRQFYLRMNLNKLMVTRFSSRIREMQLNTRVLSILAHAVPRRSTELLTELISPDHTPEHQEAKTILPFDSHRKEHQFFPEISTVPERKTPPPLEKVSPECEPDRSKAIEILRKSSFSKHFSNFIHKHRDQEGDSRPPQPSFTRQSLSEIFSEIVESSQSVGEATVPEDFGIQQSFWSRLAEVTHGSLVIDTASGKLIIRNKKHAISFGKRLFTLLSRGGHKKVTGARIAELIRRHIKEGDDLKEILERAQALFHLPAETDPDYETTSLTLLFVNEVCISVYRTRRNIASSLSDFGELRKSLIAVTDVLFWIIMVIVAQMIVKVDLESIFAPVLTLIFAVSFAVGPVVSNLFLAIGFVSFMLPYDVGDRVAIGTGPTRIVGNISRVTLLQTTLTTIYNERVMYDGIY